MEFFNEIKAWLRYWNAERKERSEMRRMSAVEEESRRRLQVREFRGKVFVCLDGVPLLEDASLKESLPETLSEMRWNFQEWRMQNAEKRGIPA